MVIMSISLSGRACERAHCGATPPLSQRESGATTDREAWLTTHTQYLVYYKEMRTVDTCCLFIPLFFLHPFLHAQLEFIY